MPDMGYGKVNERKRSPSDKSKSYGKKGIRDLIIDHLKSNIVTQEDAHKYLNGVSNKGQPNIEVYDLLSKYRKEEMSQYKQH